MSELDELLKNEQYEEASQKARELLSENSQDASLWYYLFLADNKNYTEFDGDGPSNELSLNKALELADSALRKRIEDELRLYKALSLVPGMCFFIRNAELGCTDKAREKGNELFKVKCSVTGLNAITDGVSSLVKKAETTEQVLCYHDFASWLLAQTNDISVHKLLSQTEDNSLYPKKKEKAKPRFGRILFLFPYVLFAFLSIFINYFTCSFIRFFRWIGAIFRHQGLKAFFKYCEILFGGLIYIVVCLFYEFYIVIYCIVSTIRRTMNPWKGFGMIFSTVFHMFYGTKK